MNASRLKNPFYFLGIGNITFDELVVVFGLYVFEIFKVTRIGQIVKIDDMIVRVLINKPPNHMGSNKSCSSRDDDIFSHLIGFTL